MTRIPAGRWGAVRALLLAGLAFLAGCGGIASSPFSGDVDALLSRGEAYLTRIERRPGLSLTDAEVIALGYAERVRLGLGSPFRTIEYALRDADLPEEVREPLAFGLLNRVMEGRTYHVEPRVLELARLAGVPGGRSAGAEQLELIERAIASAPTAAAGERTVRMGYMLASAERTVEPGQTSILAHVAALVADRRRAREDAVRLLRTASANGIDPMWLLSQWRRELRFTVESPAQVILTARDEEAVAERGPELALALRGLAQRERAAGPRGPASRRAPSGAGESLLDAVAAERLLRLAEERDYPAQAPIAVAVAINQDGFVDRGGLSSRQREARECFAAHAWNEERLVAGAAELRALEAWGGVRPSLIMLQAATFLRVWNQEEPWVPGDPSPTTRELEARFGITEITFDDDVPAAWRPYYLRHLGRGLSDLRRVLPVVSLRGLRIHIGEIPQGVTALALHEPRTRTLYLPPMTGAGTLAHELAHDLDWQLARQRYSARGGYATDLAVRDRRGDRIAAAMMELSQSLAQPAAFGSAKHNTRPAEVFARGADWLVATALAREGRTGAYLTSFQDPVLTGYGTTRGPDISGAAVPALLTLLDAVAPVPEPSREWILRNHGPRRSLTGIELTRAVVEAGAGLPAEERLAEIQRVARQSFQAVSQCRYGTSAALRRLVAAQHDLATASLEAALRGAAIDAVRDLAEAHAGEGMRDSVDEWLAWRLYGAPEAIDPRIEELAPAFEDILLRAEMIAREGATTTEGSAFRMDDAIPFCGGNPFAAHSPASLLGR